MHKNFNRYLIKAKYLKFCYRQTYDKPLQIKRMKI